MPPYNENVTIYRGRAPEHDVEQRVAGVTPSKVRKLSGEPLESPSDKLSVREQRKRTPIRKIIVRICGFSHSRHHSTIIKNESHP